MIRTLGKVYSPGPTPGDSYHTFDMMKVIIKLTVKKSINCEKLWDKHTNLSPESFISPYNYCFLILLFSEKPFQDIPG